MNSTRTRRATGGQETSEIARMIVRSVGWSRVTTTIVSRKGGTVWKESVPRIRMSSTRPP